jgi:nitrogen fixation/metabolism regulation signal transduction histidine kinase
MILWWLQQVVLTLVAVFFLAFGIQILVGAYRLNDPFTFIMTFFASNLIILISLTLLIGFVYRAWRVFQALRKDGPPDGEP